MFSESKEKSAAQVGSLALGLVKCGGSEGVKNCLVRQKIQIDPGGEDPLGVK